MIISFLAGSQRQPIGGVTTRYEYANAMVRRGHEVHLVHASWLTECVRSLDELDWFRFEPAVQHHFTGPSGGVDLPRADLVGSADLPAEAGLPFEFIQGARPFGLPKIVEAFERPGPKVFVARWLGDAVRAEGVPDDRFVCIPNGIDHGDFRLTRPIAGRPPRVAMLHHRAPFKGTAEGIAALELVRARVPDVEVVLFGADPAEEPVPPWMEFRLAPPRAELVDDVYNGSRVFLCPSRYGEGFGKTSLEAMACGCALVTTANGGSSEFAAHDETALVCEPDDVEAMAAHVVALLEDDDRRVAIAERGVAKARTFSWDASAAQLEAFFERYLADPVRYGGGNMPRRGSSV